MALNFQALCLFRTIFEVVWIVFLKVFAIGIGRVGTSVATGVYRHVYRTVREFDRVFAVRIPPMRTTGTTDKVFHFDF